MLLEPKQRDNHFQNDFKSNPRRMLAFRPHCGLIVRFGTLWDSDVSFVDFPSPIPGRHRSPVSFATAGEIHMSHAFFTIIALFKPRWRSITRITFLSKRRKTAPSRSSAGSSLRTELPISAGISGHPAELSLSLSLFMSAASDSTLHWVFNLHGLPNS